MKKTPAVPDLSQFLERFHPLLAGCPVYDSSCSREARVWFLEREGGLYLKRSPKGTLAREAAMTRYFHGKGLAAEVLAYESLNQDWLLTAAVPGEDCTHENYLADPGRLSALLGERLRQLHSLPFDGCPVPDHTARYLALAEKNRNAGAFDPDGPFADAADAWQTLERHRGDFRTDTLLHGDYCLPNIMLKDWEFSGFIDLDHAGVGDRHVDLYWGLWTLRFNLKTDAWGGWFLDAYGRDLVEEELLRAVSAAECFG